MSVAVVTCKWDGANTHTVPLPLLLVALLSVALLLPSPVSLTVNPLSETVADLLSENGNRWESGNGSYHDEATAIWASCMSQMVSF